MNKEEFKKIAIIAAEAADSKKASDVKVLDLCGQSVIAEYIVMSVIASSPQLEAVMQETEDRLKKEGVYLLHRDGMQSKNWRVQDYGGIIVHSFDKEVAEFYAIDKVFSEAKTIDWQKELKTGKKNASIKKTVKKNAAKKNIKTEVKTSKKTAKQTSKKAVKTGTKKIKAAAKKASKVLVKKIAVKKDKNKKTVKALAMKATAKKTPTKKTISKKKK